VNMRFVKPLDGELLDAVAARFTRVLTLEDNVVSGGFGSAVAEYYAAKETTGVHIRIHGVPDRFIDHGSPADLHKELGLDAEGIVRTLEDFLHSTRAASETPRGVAAH